MFEACVCFVFEVCVGVVPRVCEAMEAASAPAGKPPAKRLGKHRASHPSDLNDILKKVPYLRGDFINKKHIILINIIVKHTMSFQAF